MCVQASLFITISSQLSPKMALKLSEYLTLYEMVNNIS